MALDYTTTAELVVRYGEQEMLDVTNKDAAGAVVNATVAQRAIDDAEAIVDSYLAQRYALPLELVPGAVSDAAAVIARYKLHESAPSQAIVDAKNDALRWLRDVATGKAALVGIEPPGTGAGSYGGVAVRASPPVFTDAMLARMPGSPTDFSPDWRRKLYE